MLGVNNLDNLTAQRDRMLPLFAVLVLVIETMGLATLITDEVEKKTIRALLVTPMRTWQIFVAKGLFGMLLAFGQVFILMLLTGGLTAQPVLIIAALLAGSLLVTGISFLMASVSRDMLAVTAWGILVVIILSLPSFAVMFPGLISDWVQVIPSYFLVDTVFDVLNNGAGWADVSQNIITLLVISVGLLAVGSFLLERKMQERNAL